MPYITDIYAREVLDSRGNPTVEVEVTTENGSVGRAISPSGASTGIHEAFELRDNDPKRYKGLGVLKAVENVNEVIAPELMGYDVREQRLLDKKMRELDGTTNFAKLGANASIAVSLAIAKAASVYNKVPLYKYLGGVNAHTLPVPMMNILNGGKHAKNSVDFQEIMIVPVNATTFKDALRMGSEVFHSLQSILSKKNMDTFVGDEGGFAVHVKSNEEAIKLVVDAITDASYKPGVDIFIALDVASSEFYNSNTKQYYLNAEKKAYKTSELIKYYQELVSKFPIISIEDGLEQDDYEGWVSLTKTLGNKIALVGDDLFTTNCRLIKNGYDMHFANSVLIKPNQIGLLTDTLDAIEYSKRIGYNVIISHRSGDTEDSFLADLAVATNASLIKCGSLSRSERICKYNQLLRIEDELEEAGTFASTNAFIQKNR